MFIHSHSITIKNFLNYVTFDVEHFNRIYSVFTCGLTLRIWLNTELR